MCIDAKPQSLFSFAAIVRLHRTMSADEHTGQQLDSGVGEHDAAGERPHEFQQSNHINQQSTVHAVAAVA